MLEDMFSINMKKKGRRVDIQKLLQGANMRFKLLLVLLITGCIFGQGSPHAIYGLVQNSDITIPTDVCLSFEAIYKGDTLNYPEDSDPGDGTYYKDDIGIWVIEAGTFSPTLMTGDIIHICFNNICNSESNEFDIVIDLTGPEQDCGLVILSSMGIVNKEIIDDELLIYPNPFNDRCYINKQVKIYSVMGELIDEVSDSWDGTDANGNSVPSGVYIVRLDEGATANVLLLK